MSVHILELSQQLQILMTHEILTRKKKKPNIQAGTVRMEFFSLVRRGRQTQQKVKYEEKSANSPSRLMPTAMHFFNRQYWHRLRLTLWIKHCWFLVHGRYWIFCWIERRKKPCREKICKKEEVDLVFFRFLATLHADFELVVKRV